MLFLRENCESAQVTGITLALKFKLILVNNAGSSHTPGYNGEVSGHPDLNGIEAVQRGEITSEKIKEIKDLDATE